MLRVTINEMTATVVSISRGVYAVPDDVSRASFAPDGFTFRVRGGPPMQAGDYVELDVGDGQIPCRVIGTVDDMTILHELRMRRAD